MDITHSFQDKQDRRIEFQADGGVRAYHAGREVGSITVDEDEFGTFLFSMDVEVDYRRAGIATEMMRIIAEQHGPGIGKPDRWAQGRKDDASSYYTAEGRALISHCIGQGILASEPALLDDG